MASSSFNLIRITIGSEDGCPGGEREKYQLQHGFYTTSSKIPGTIWNDDSAVPRYAIVYYSKKFPDKWCAGAFKGIYEVGDKIDITTQEEWDQLYPEGWWGHSDHADLYRSTEWSWENWEKKGRNERGFKLTQLTDARIPEIKVYDPTRDDEERMRRGGYASNLGQMARMLQPWHHDVVKRMVEKCKAGDYDM